VKAFAALYARLDSTTRTSRKLAALCDYFNEAAPADAAWAVYFLIGRKPKRLVLARCLREWSARLAGVPDWLFDESYDAVGDLAETIALLLPPPASSSTWTLSRWVEESLLPLRGLPEQQQRLVLEDAWRQMDHDQRFLWNKLLTGAFRVGVSEGLVVRALAEVSRLPPAVIAHRLMGQWEPSAEFLQSVLASASAGDDVSRPYPFFLAHPLEGGPETSLGAVGDWLAEWKWDGIRAQLIRRQGWTFLWSRGEELITERFPEITEAARLLPDGTVLDGEILAWKDGRVLPFAQLQRRIGRKSVGRKLLADVPARYMVFDLLELGGADIRALALAERRDRLRRLLASAPCGSALALSEAVAAGSWEELARMRAASREHGVEGLMLKRLDAAYGTGRERGPWWKWKIEPYSVDAVLIYAQRGHGRRASLYTDYTFAVWSGEELVPFAKAYSGLSDEEIREVDRFVRENTLEKFGPVRRVKPELVFELAFESIGFSSRHKSGIAVRFPRIARWRRDKLPASADTLDLVRSLIRGK
jgi:DNA ligase-1